jgi:hypothetical protein
VEKEMITLILTLAVVGFLVWLIVNYIPMPDPIQKVIIVLVVIVMILYVMRALGVADIPLGGR